MVLSGKEIEKNLGEKIIIEPFNKSQLKANGYDLRLSNELMVYTEVRLDMRRPNRVRRLIIPETGLVLEANRLYLGRTVEYTKTEGFVPKLAGRVSVGGLGLFVNVTNGGDVGFAGYWTLAMFCLHPIKIYPNVRIAQISYRTIMGEYDTYEDGKYQNNTGIQSSMLYKDFEQGSMLKGSFD